MTPYSDAPDLPRRLARLHDRIFRKDLGPGVCRHDVIDAELLALAGRSGGKISIRKAGASIERRPIRVVTFGRGRETVLMWTQMHGDEPTATLALMDVLALVAEPPAGEEWLGEFLDAATVHAIPMLNPDGAERGTRENAAGVDVNRDARALVSPEARILREAQRRLSPGWGFNLHDQPLYSVGDEPKVAALSLLAPALDTERSVPPVRERAMRLAAVVAKAVEPLAAGHVTAYDDAFTADAFGDSIQSWGTSTILIESGHWPGDAEKLFVRKLNFVAWLAALHAIATGAVHRESPDAYLQLPPNGKTDLETLLDGPASA